VIESHPDVVLVAVVGVPHDIYQTVGKAFVMPRPGTEISDEELEKLCRENLANYKIPKSFEIRPMLPMLPNGKINRMALFEAEKARVD
jgi:acyl-CoA synthetase (AMP-forming)/AMP-acid ligase II